MKTIHTITGKCTDSTAQPAPVASTDIHNTQAQKGFWRRKRVAKSGTYYESSTGGSVFISTADEWAMVEAHEPKCCVPPKPAEPPKSVPPTPPKIS
jgi:hypothetical protein